jgi:hypothetical protein
VTTPEWLFPLMVMSIIMIFPFGLFFRRVGRSPWLSAIGLIPFGIMLLPWMGAFMRWKAAPPLPKARRVSRRQSVRR